MNKKSGFTLLEVVIALGIMASVMVLLTSGWRGNFNRVRKIKYRTQAAYLLQQKMTEVENLYRERPAQMPQDLQKGKFEGEKFKNFSWEWESKEFEMPDLKKLLAASGQKDQVAENIAGQLQNYFERSIYEVKVTLLYKSALKAEPIKTSVSTIFVDYDQSLNMGLGQ